jgi:hypothetical protein
MARILTATRGLAHTLATGEWDQRLPKVFDITQERLDRVHKFAPAITAKPANATWLGGLFGAKGVDEEFDYTRGL